MAKYSYKPQVVFLFDFTLVFVNVHFPITGKYLQKHISILFYALEILVYFCGGELVVLATMYDLTL